MRPLGPPVLETRVAQVSGSTLDATCVRQGVKKMKKLVALFAVVGLSLALVACGGAKKEGAEAAPAAAAAPADAPAAPADAPADKK